MDLVHKFDLIKNWYEKQDSIIRDREGKSFFRTSHGLWGAAGMLDMFEFFLKNEADDFKSGVFADYGSGDGRIVLIASLFTDAVGVEGEQELVDLSERAKKELIEHIPELSRATFKCKNYYEEKHDEYGTIFTFPDHPFPEVFEKKLLEFSGTLLVYNNIHRPNILKKGKTYWVQQIPIVSYACGESGREGRE